MELIRNKIVINRLSGNEFVVYYDDVKIANINKSLKLTIEYDYGYNDLSLNKRISVNNFIDTYLDNVGRKLDVKTLPLYSESIGDVFPLEKFAQMVEDGHIMDDDGFTGAVLVKNRILITEGPSPSELESIHDDLILLQKKHGRVSIVWYNK